MTSESPSTPSVSPRRWKKTVLRVMVGLVLGFVGLALWLPARFFHPSDDQRIHSFGSCWQTQLKFPCRVLVWNLYKGQRDQFADDYKKLAKDRDLLLLQEFWSGGNVVSALEATEGVAFQQLTSFGWVKDGTVTGVSTGAIATATEISWKLTSDTEPLTQTPKSVLITQYPIASQSDPLLVINIHAINFVTSAAFRRQVESLTDVIAGHSGPVLLGGDFNTNSRSKLEWLHKWADGLQLQPVTWNPDERTSFPTDNLPLDHVFVRDLTVSEAQAAGDISGSDHSPLLLKIESLR